MPRVAVRSSYRVGHPVSFSLTRAFHIRFRNMSLAEMEEVDYGHDSTAGSSSGGSGGNSLDVQPRFLSLHPVPTSPGIFQVTVRYEYTLTSNREHTTWKWPSRARFPLGLLPKSKTRVWQEKSDKPMYSCSFEIPVQLNVVPEDMAESIYLVSNPDLDAEMRQRIHSRPSKWVYVSHTSEGRRETTGGIELYMSNLPVDVVFDVSFLDKDGKRIKMKRPQSKTIRARKDMEVKRRLHLDALGIEELGVHRCVILLSPSLEGAYHHPEIKEIWNGELKFPVSITVTEGESNR